MSVFVDRLQEILLLAKTIEESPRWSYRLANIIPLKEKTEHLTAMSPRIGELTKSPYLQSQGYPLYGLHRDVLPPT